jgi:HPt (histidine-containing phosphotransfer) domain-containing protein
MGFKMSDLVIDETALDAIRAIQQPGMEDLTKIVVSAFLEQLEAVMSALADGLAEGNAHSIADRAHFLKSSSANVGAVRVASISREIEAAARQGLLDEIDPMYLRLEGELEQAVGQLCELVANPTEYASSA